MDIIDAYALLSSMRKNLPENHSSYEEKYVRQYHNLVSSLETQLSIDLSPYKLDEFLLKREITSEAMSFWFYESKITYSEDRYVDRCDLIIMLDALLMRFSIGWEDRKIGFSIT